MTPPVVSNAVLLERIETLRDAIQKLETAIVCSNQEFSNLRTEYNREHVRVVANTEKAIAKTEDHEQRIRALEDAVKPIVLLTKVIGAVGVIMAGTLIAFLWTLITHQVQIVIP